VLNASLGLVWESWEFSIFGKNLTNDRKIIQSPEVNTLVEGYTVHPLTVGMMGKVHF
jgi:hypothetical protein